MISEIISIGDELVTGQTVDTNAAWLAGRLAELGIRCIRHTTIPDDVDAIRSALERSAEEVDLVIATGGLGPTPDDLTRDALAAALGSPLRLHDESLDRIQAYFDQRRRRMHQANRVQAMIPDAAEPLPNDCGTAPGILARLHRAEVFCLPGVPNEMRAMFDAAVCPRLSLRAAGAPIVRRALHTFGMSEAEVGERLSDLMARGRNPSVGTSADELVISVRVLAAGSTPRESENLLQRDVQEIRARLGEVVFGEAGQSLAHAVAALLIEQKATLATAESCTGGLLAKRLTDVPGSSAFFREGFITYSNEAKRDRLGVPMGLIAEHGAVSAQVAEAMAASCRRIAGADYALSATGIAGPSGGSAQKPVGLVYIALATRRETIVKALRLGETLTRQQVRDRTAKIALNLLRLSLLRSRE